MIHIHNQTFYSMDTGNSHEVSITFGGINPLCRGHYDITVDGKLHSQHDSKLSAFNEVVNILKANNWKGINNESK